MSVFQHPHLTRGIVQTAAGAFAISRGLVEMPDEVGQSLGWRLVSADPDKPAEALPSVREASAHRRNSVAEVDSPR
jgi:hypothetical protein